MLMMRSFLQGVTIASLLQAVTANVNFVFGAGNFQGLSDQPGGFGESGHTTGFSLILDDSTQIYDSATVNDYSPCFNTDPASRIEVSSDCWAGPITFTCKSGFDGIPETCSGDYEYNHFPGASDSNTDFIGIAISQSGHCGGSVVVDTSGCNKDNANLRFNYPTNR